VQTDIRKPARLLLYKIETHGSVYVSSMGGFILLENAYLVAL
jgi:hypothetical protein